jgi:hypothetical protein
MTKDIMFNNSNVLYDLRYEAFFDETVQADPKQLTYNPKPVEASPYQSPAVTPIPTMGFPNRSSASNAQATRSVSPYTQPAFPPPPKAP